MTSDLAPPEEGTVERWAWDYILTTELDHKLSPPPPPTLWEANPPSRAVAQPGRPSVLSVTERADKTRGLMAPSGRARACHTFLHHELQAAELMGWALLRFVTTPRAFREGLVRILLDETRHMRMYAAHIAKLGYAVGDFPVRDWFWSRIPTCVDAASFVSVMGLGLESANLEHTVTFAAKFRAAGDEEGARIQEIVGREEIAHVRFGAQWFRAFVQTDQEEEARASGPLDFDLWRAHLPAPLTPLLMRGRPIQRDMRRKAGQPDDFIDSLERWSESNDAPSSKGLP